ncbi:MAG TPA: twin-arginine translocation signal domain-containing protein [Fimbriiglobus sp.]|jgi:hypothetical protein
MHRRHFLKSSAAAAAALAATGPTLLGIPRRTDDKNPVVGSGDYQYECHHYWGKLPASIEWQTTHGTAVDSQGLIYITHQGVGKNVMDTVVVFDDTGRYVRSFGKEWHGGGHGIDIRKDGADEFLYLSMMSSNGPVAKCTLKGEVVWKAGRPETDTYKNPRAPFKPTNVAFCPDGSFFVADGYGSNWVQKHDKAGTLLNSFGGTGGKDGQFRTPHGLWVDRRDKAHPVLVVCDRANARLQWFDLDGKFLRAIPAKTEVYFPAHIDTRGDMLMIADLHTRISLYKNDKLVAQLGEDPAWRARVVASLSKGPAIRSQPKQWPAGKFVHPHDACFDRDGNIFVAEWVDGGRITMLKKVA